MIAKVSPTDRTRTVFITGCSSGLGRALALAALARGDRVVATARDPGALADIIAIDPTRAVGVRLDVTSESDARSAVEHAINTFGAIDVLINNAGFGLMGTVEEVRDSDADAVFGANFFGPLRLIRTVLPYMRAQAAGHIVNIASIGGLRGRPGSGIYSSSKFALVGLSEALAGEVKEFGINVTVVLPGGIRTDFAGRSLAFAPSLPAYAETAAGRRRREVATRDGAQPGSPDAMAQAILDAVEAPEPPLWLVLGTEALRAAREKCERLAEALDRWSAVSGSVDYDRPAR